jgi:hypothetical protein
MPLPQVTEEVHRTMLTKSVIEETVKSLSQHLEGQESLQIKVFHKNTDKKEWGTNTTY